MTLSQGTAVWHRFDSPIGPLALSATRQGLSGLWFDGDRHMPEQPAADPSSEAEATLRAAAVQLTEYFAGRRQRFDLRLDLQGGTAFQQAVWRTLLDIAHGETSNYGDVARRIGRPDAVRAVGGAVGRNPIGIVVPCHRVLGRDRSLTGFAGGLDRKRALLRIEGIAWRETLPA